LRIFNSYFEISNKKIKIIDGSKLDSTKQSYRKLFIEQIEDIIHAIELDKMILELNDR